MGHLSYKLNHFIVTVVSTREVVYVLLGAGAVDSRDSARNQWEQSARCREMSSVACWFFVKWAHLSLGGLWSTMTDGGVCWLLPVLVLCNPPHVNILIYLHCVYFFKCKNKEFDKSTNKEFELDWILVMPSLWSRVKWCLCPARLSNSVAESAEQVTLCFNYVHININQSFLK